MKISNLKQAKVKLSSSSFKTAKIGFNYFGSSLFEIKGIPLDIKGLSNDFDKEKFLLNYKSGHKYYHIDENSKFN
jgi:hypothetical protein